MDSVPSAISDDKNDKTLKSTDIAQAYREMYQESTDHVHSNPIHVGHTPNNKKLDYTSYHQRAHGVHTKWHKDNTITFHGPKANVRKAITDHTGEDPHSEDLHAQHPHIFNEEVHMPSHLSMHAHRASTDAHNSSGETHLEPTFSKHLAAHAKHYHAAELHSMASQAHGKDHPAFQNHNEKEAIHTNKAAEHKAELHKMMAPKKPAKTK